MLRRMTVLALAASLATGAAFAEPPRFGRMIWTELQRTGRWGTNPPQMQIGTRAYHPLLDTMKKLDFFGADSGVWFKLGPVSGEKFPRMHATFDHLGTGVVAGTGPGVTLSSSDGKGRVSVDGKILGYRLDLKTRPAELAAEIPVTPPAEGGYFFPSVTRDGRTGYASRTQTGQQGIVEELHQIDMLRPGAPTTPLGVRGSHPVVSPNGEFLAWVERTPEGVHRLSVATTKEPATVLRRLVSGDRRIIRPAWRGDSQALAFCSDFQNPDTAENWDIYAVMLKDLDTSERPMADAVVRKITKAPGVHCVWPSWSADGRHIAFSRKLDAVAKYDVYVQELEPNDELKAVGDPEKVSDKSEADSDAMWVSYFQDINPPCLRVELVPTDSGQSNVITLANFDDSVGTAQVGSGPDRLLGTAFFSAKGNHFARDMKTPMGGATSAAPSAVTTVIVEKQPDNKPWRRENASPVKEKGAYLGLHAGKVVAYDNATDSKPLGQLTALGSMGTAGVYKGIQGFYVNKDARIVVKVSAKDNQFRRAYPGSEQAANQGDTPWTFPDGDGRSMAPTSVPPYLPLMGREQVLKGEPGVAWWWEDEQYNVLGGVNVSEYICRFGNFEGTDEAASKPKMVFFRAVANDLWANRTELTIPVFVYTKELDLRVLNFDGARKDQVRGGASGRR